MHGQNHIKHIKIVCCRKHATLSVVNMFQVRMCSYGNTAVIIQGC